MFFSGFHQGDLGDLRRYARTVGGHHLFERLYMNLRKIAAAAGIATGAAMAFAPLAAADTPITTTVDSEITSLNSMFTSDATLFGVGKDLIGPTAGQPFETISLAGAPDAGTANSFDYFLYGLNPIDNASGDPGAYDLFNGSLAKFDDAINFGLYALENGGAALPSADFATDLFGAGVGSDLATQLTGETATQAISTLFSDGMTDLAGYFDFSALGSLF